jgi:hypothetical protein
MHVFPLPTEKDVGLMRCNTPIRYRIPFKRTQDSTIILCICLTRIEIQLSHVIQRIVKTQHGGVLHQLSSVYRHFILNKGVVVRDRFDKRYTKSYYLCAVVLFDVSKEPDIVYRHELSSEE